MPDERLGEQVCAWIKLKEGEQATEQEMKDYCKGEVRNSNICAASEINVRTYLSNCSKCTFVCSAPAHVIELTALTAHSYSYVDAVS